MIVDIVNRWLEGVQVDLVKNYDRLGLRASGRWAASLEQFAKFTDNGLSTGILGEQYTGALTDGRKPTNSTGGGAITLRAAIRQWIDDKGITPDGISKDSLAYVIARKIHNEGIKVPNKYNAGGLVSDVVNQSRIDELINEMKLFYVEEMRGTYIKYVQ